MEQQDCGQILSGLTLEEKASLMSGAGTWETKALPDKGVQAVRMSDGPHGLRREAFVAGRVRGSVPATCFPTASALACSWNEQLVRSVGEAIAEECRAQGVNVLLGPGVNIKRSPLCGRNFEYYSEDPLLAGKMAAGFIRGVEQKGVAASLKHFAANNQETLRLCISAEVDERALHEVYLRPFEIAVREGKPGTVMCSYNRVNGVFASENKALLTDILRGQWGFDGLVVSDWGAVSDRPAGVAAGLDLEMPYSGGRTDRDVAEAVRGGRLPAEALDAAAERVLRLAQRYAPGAPCVYDQSAHHALAVEACERSAVLLKNDGILPLPEKENIAVIGALASAQCRYQGCGSSIVNPHNKVSFTDAMTQNGAAYINYAKGYNAAGEEIDCDLEEQAVRFARTAKVTVYFMGLTDSEESEGYDRERLELPQNQTHLLEKLASASENIVVVLAGGGPCAVPWLRHARAVLYTALGGEGLGEATFNLLFGHSAPTGKLAETWPLALADTPCARWFPMGPRAVTYNESIYVGYRYYDKADKAVAFPFGHGLTYTQFAYSDLHLALAPDGGADVAFTLQNTGARAGVEIAQVYAGCPNSAVHRPVRVLAGFVRAALEPGERCALTVHVPPAALAFYSPWQQRFVSEAGSYQFWVGASSRSLLLTAQLTLEGEAVTPPAAQSKDGPYGSFRDNAFPDAAFYAVHSRPPQDNTLPSRGNYTMLTPLGQMRASRLARGMAVVCRWFAARHMHFSTSKAVNRKVSARAVEEMPFKNVELNALGYVRHETAQALLDACNGRGGMLAVLRTLLPGWAQKK